VSKKALVTTGEWAKHLRPYGKRRFAKKERKAAKLDGKKPQA
jgi:hypothetical protein